MAILKPSKTKGRASKASSKPSKIKNKLNKAKSSVKAKKTTPKSKKTAPKAKKAAVTAKKTAVTAKKTTPKAKKTAPKAKKTAVTAKKTTPKAKKTTPKAKKTTPKAKKTAVTAKKTAVTAKKTTPKAKKAAVTAKKTTPKAKKTAVTVKKTAPKAKKAAVTAKKTAPKAKKTAPKAKKTAPKAKKASAKFEKQKLKEDQISKTRVKETNNKITEKRKQKLNTIKRQPPKQVIPSKLDYEIGEYVVYPSHGVGKVTAIEDKLVGEQTLKMFVVIFDKEKMKLRVPVDKTTGSGMRHLSSPSIMEKAISTLKGKARQRRVMWSRRAQDYDAKLNSGDPVAIAEVIRDLFRKGEEPEQSYSERQMYEAAMERLAREYAALEETDTLDATERLEEVLKTA